jgi:hypothetical protein
MTYPDHIDLETPEGDAAEQATDALPGDYDVDETVVDDIEAPEWDAREQHRTVELEDEYR